MIVLALDPGTTHTAFVRLVDGMPSVCKRERNIDMLHILRQWFDVVPDVVAIEMIASYGMPVGREVFETCVWIGRYFEAIHRNHAAPQLIYRKDVKLHLCGQTRAKDANVRQALIDRYGPGKDKAIGLKRSPGPLYGIAGDVWAALAVAVTAHDTESRGRNLLEQRPKMESAA